MDSNGSSTALSAALRHHENMMILSRLPTSPRTNGDYNSNQLNFTFGNHEYNDYGCDDNNDENMKLTDVNIQMLFKQIASKDRSARTLELQVLQRLILNCARQQCGINISCSPNQVHFENNPLINTEVPEQIGEEDNSLVCSMQQAIATLLQMSFQCPYRDIQIKCDEILNELRNMRMHVPEVSKEVSKFFSNSETVPVETDKDDIYAPYLESFVQNSRLENMMRVMSMHPQYLHQFWDTHFALLSGQSVLSCDVRSYISLMASSRHKCLYLVRLLKDHFLMQGGDKAWLKGIKFAPKKLQMLSTLNKLLAHRPWLITSAHIKNLTERGAGAQWQYQELAHAMVLMGHFHSLAIFCMATGVNLEIDHKVLDIFSKVNQSTPTTPLHAPPSFLTEGGQESLCTSMDDVEVLERMKKLDESEVEEVTREERNRRFELEKEEASHGHLAAAAANHSSSDELCSLYVEDPEFGYQNFSSQEKSSEEVPTFRAQDFTWRDHALATLYKYHNKIGDILDAKFSLAESLTYKTLGRYDNVDTTSLRVAIWNYVQCMYGIMYDDYNYGDIHKLMEPSLKLFIKTVSCYPCRMNKPIYDGFWKKFRHSEKVQVCIMIQEARLQVGLLYGMRAFTQALQES